LIKKIENLKVAGWKPHTSNTRGAESIMGYKNKQKAQKKKQSPPQETLKEKKFKEAKKHYYVQKALGRPIKKFNLLICRDDGDWFSSEDDLAEGFIISVLKKLEAQYPDNCQNWYIMYALFAAKKKQEEQFFCYMDVSDHRQCGGEKSIIDKFEYFTWKEAGEE